MKGLITCCLLLMSGIIAFGQTADKLIGCAPVEINFSAVAMGSYFWDFKDGASSELQNPSHIFTQTGVFNVELYDVQGGVLVGTVMITILPSVQAMFSADVQTGCPPLEVNFTNESIIPDSLPGNITYEWDFGEGTTLIVENPTYTYNNPGRYNVSLKVTTDEPTCDDILIESFFIEILEDLPAPVFTVPSGNSICDSPAVSEFVISNPIPGATYTWDFGDGTSLETTDVVVAHTYEMEGSFQVSVEVSSPAGCPTTYSLLTPINVLFGPPEINPLFDDVICFNAETRLMIETTTDQFTWNFAVFQGAGMNIDTMPIVFYPRAGFDTIYISAGPATCRSLDTFIIEISEPNADFTVLPFFSCDNPIDYSFEAEDKSHQGYTWTLGEEMYNAGPIFEQEYSTPTFVEDSFFRRMDGLVSFTLMVSDSFGCSNVESDSVQIFQPQAHFVLDTAEGCAPLHVDFESMIESPYPINYSFWDFGDGTILETDGEINPDHIYTEPGTYYVRLIIENDSMCRDTSPAVLIQVGEPIAIEYTVDQLQGCPGDTINFDVTTIDDRIDSWHFYADDGRVFHCASDPSASHTFLTEVGVTDVWLMGENNGCYFSGADTLQIETLGPIADLDFNNPCDRPYDVIFYNNSQSFTSANFIVEGNVIPATDSITYTFADRGVYTVYLEVDNDNTGCPTSVDSVEVFITEVMADFDIEETYCTGELVMLDASGGQDVNGECFKGYTWFLPEEPRPWTVGVDTFDYTVKGSGDEEFILVVEDINGCTDTLTKIARIFDIDPGFIMDKTRICLPMEVSFTDTTRSDTTISSWMWSFGSEEQNPTYEFDDFFLQDSLIEVQLMLTDAAGCEGTVSQFITVYELETMLTIDPDSNICVGDEVVFTATDFTDEGSFLNFNWSSTNGGMSMDSFFVETYNSAGEFQVTLNIEEDATSCMDTFLFTINVQEYPEVSFILESDSFCADQLKFTNTSDPTENIFFTWFPGDGASKTEGELNYVHSYDPGSYTVTLVGETTNGCADTFQLPINVVEPAGDFTMSNDVVCVGDSIVFTLTDLENINRVRVDFGDGSSLENFTPPFPNQIVHVYERSGTLTTSMVTFTLYAGDDCEFDKEQPITILGALAHFGFIPDSTNCSAVFIDSSLIPIGTTVDYMWDFGDGVGTSTEQNPEYIFGVPGKYPVTLTVLSSDGTTECVDMVTDSVDFPGIPFAFGVPNVFTPNNDNTNDFFNFVIRVLDENDPLPDFEVSTFKVFNRWGKVVYDNFDPDNGWNGRIDNEPAPAEVYAYIIELTLKGGETIFEKGNVTLIRDR